MTDYTISIRCVDIFNERSLEEGDRDNPGVFEVTVVLTLQMKIPKIGEIISEKIKEVRGPRAVYRIDAFCIDGYVFDGQEDSELSQYIFKGEEGQKQIEAFAVYDGPIKAVNSGAKFFQDISNENARLKVDQESAKGVLQDMKTGLAILADCKRCNEVLKQIPLFKGRTACFNLMTSNLKCPNNCGNIVTLKGPSFLNVEYKFKGEQVGADKPVDQPWQTIDTGKIFYFNDDPQNNQFSTNIVPWKKLIIYVKVLDSNWCKACQQKLNRDDEDEVVKGKICCHEYHDSCYRCILRSQSGRCVVPGCGKQLGRR